MTVYVLVPFLDVSRLDIPIYLAPRAGFGV
jgi:hypothetical protein